MSRWWVKSHQTADFGDNRDTKRQKYVTVVSWQHKHTFYLILLREDSSDSGGLRSLRSLRPLPTYPAWSVDHVSPSGPSLCPCEDLFQWPRLVNGRGPRRSRGYSKTFPRDFLTFLDSFSSYNLVHATASVGNKENSTP